MNTQEVITQLKFRAKDGWASGSMARFGIVTEAALGVPVPEIRKLAREIGKNHELAEQLWQSGIHEARLLAAMVDDYKQVTEAQMERWVKDINSWDICDQVCGNLFDKTPVVYKKAIEWSKRPEEFVKRAGFALMAYLAVHDKTASDDKFWQFLPIIKRESHDERNFVRKAVNWALRQIGKRNNALREVAIKTAEEIKTIDSKAARWIAADALRELKGRL